MYKRFIEGVVFLSGAIVMVIELVGSRVLAPFVGSSTIVWTSLIGIVLGSLSVGYYWGGRIADRGVSSKHLARVFIASSFFVFFIALFSPVLGNGFVGFSIITTTVLLTLFLFAPATLLLGMVTPFALKMYVSDINEIGSKAGNLYALSTLGSIVGTFMGGFILISFFGTNTIIVGCASILLSLGIIILLFKKKVGRAAIGLFFLMGMLTTQFSLDGYYLGEVIADIDTKYSRFLVIDGEIYGKEARMLSNGVNIVQSGIFLERPFELMSPYTHAFDMAELYVSKPKNALIVGAGVFTQPKHFISRHSESYVDVVDIDEQLEEISHEYFGYIPDERIRSIVADGRVFMKSTTTTYDIIYMDAYPSHMSIPPHLATVEAVELMAERLSPDGVLVANVIGQVEGLGSRITESMYQTYKQVFPNVRLFQVLDRSKKDIQNIIILAYRDGVEIDPGSIPDEFVASVLTREFSPERRGLVLTDDFVPVERLLFGMQL